MPFAQRDQSGNIVGLFAQKQPGVAEEPVPDGTTLTEMKPDRVKRELKQLVNTFPDSEQESVKPVLDQISDYIAAGKLARAKNMVDNIGVAPVLSAASKQALKDKINEAQ